MNSIRQIQELNKRELENGIGPEASWHADYRDTAYVYIGGLPFELSEGDIITIFSQFGEPTYINLVRDKETGKSKGFAFLKYEDQRSTDLAVDNLGGAVVMGRTLKVDHTRYKKKDDEPDEGIDLDNGVEQIEAGDERRKKRRTSESDSEEERPMLKEELELAKLIQEHEEDDPMKAFLVQEKKEEVALALARMKDSKSSGKRHKHRHHHHKSRRPKEADEEKDDSRHSRHRKEGHDRRRSRSKDSEDEKTRNKRPSKQDGRERHRPHSRDDGNEGRSLKSRQSEPEWENEYKPRELDRTRHSYDRDDKRPRRERNQSIDRRDSGSRRYS